jgi:Trk K+ transport system NAD-binding subunit
MSAEALAVQLVAAITAELEALASEDSDAILAATSAKAAALAAVQAAVAEGAPVPRTVLEQARDLNSEAMLRARAKLISVEKRLQALRPQPLRPEPVAYGRDGRWA